MEAIILNFTCILLFLLFFLLSFLKIKRLRKSVLWYKENIPTFNQNSANKIKFTILVPCLNEYENVIQFTSHINRILDVNIKLFFIISGKSQDIGAVHSFLDTMRESNIEYLVVPSTLSENKATQINYAIKKIGLKADRKHYIVIYDADSQPDLNTFKVTEHFVISRKFPLFLQQPSIFNYNGTFIQCVDGLFQTLWSFHHEIFYWLNNAKGLKNLTYFITHGLFIRSDFLLNTPFPNYQVEDIPYGYILTLNGIIPVILPVFDYSDTPKSFKQFFLQKAKWYKGSVKALIHIFKLSDYKKFSLIMKRSMWDIEWGFVNLIMLVFCVLLCNVILMKVILFFAWIVLYYFLPLQIFYNEGKNMKIIKVNFPVWKRFFFSLVYCAIYNIGPIIGLLTLITDYKKKRNNEENILHH
ncbi:hypothetical protein ES705_09741 [subsurface metagenome]